MRRATALFALVALVGSSTVLEAQSRRGRSPDRDRGLIELGSDRQRGGFFITGGIGAGSEQYRFDGEPEYSERLTKPTLTLRLGGTPNESVRVGAELFGWANDVPGDALTVGGTESFTAAMVTAQFFPARNLGLFVKGSGGFGRSGIDFDNGASNSETGFAWSVGAGYDIQLSRNFGIGPSIDLYQGTFTTRDEPSLSERVVTIGVQVTFQTGGRGR